MSQAPQPQPEPSQPQGISLEELTEAFAQVMGTAPEPKEPTEAGTPEAAVEQPAQPVLEQPPELPPTEEDDPCPVCPRSILEAMLFVGNRESRPLSVAGAAELMRGVEPDEIPELVEELNRRYVANGCPYRIANEASGYRLTLRRAYHPLRNRFYGRVREARLSQAAIDTLAIVAYQQPLSAEQISRTRGKPSNHVLAQLVRRGLLRIERKETKRRTAQYSTTERFLEIFGLRSLEDLPQSEELQR